MPDRRIFSGGASLNLEGLAQSYGLPAPPRTSKSSNSGTAAAAEIVEVRAFCTTLYCIAAGSYICTDNGSALCACSEFIVCTSMLRHHQSCSCKYSSTEMSSFRVH
jgi:hypothetical protein